MCPKGIFTKAASPGKSRVARERFWHAIRAGWSGNPPSVAWPIRTDLLQPFFPTPETVVAATGDWDQLLRNDATSLPRLLTIRTREFADAGRLQDAAQAADKLRELPASTPVADPDHDAESAGPTAALDSRYRAARAYCSCAALVGNGRAKLDEEERAAKERYPTLSVACLKESVAGGFDNFEYLEADESFTPLRERPEFKALSPRK